MHLLCFALSLSLSEHRDTYALTSALCRYSGPCWFRRTAHLSRPTDPPTFWVTGPETDRSNFIESLAQPRQFLALWLAPVHTLTAGEMGRANPYELSAWQLYWRPGDSIRRHGFQSPMAHVRVRGRVYGDRVGASCRGFRATSHVAFSRHCTGCAGWRHRRFASVRGDMDI